VTAEQKGSSGQDRAPMTCEEILSELLAIIEDAPGEPGSAWIEERTLAITINSTALAYMLGASPASALHACALNSPSRSSGWDEARARLATLLGERAGGG
jgi:hypothetical protein